MAITVDCGEGKHDQCVGSGRVSYLVPQENSEPGEPDFPCGCKCHHLPGAKVPCIACFAAVDAAS